MSDPLSGVALVTGGGRGIGAGIARELAAAGMRVAVIGADAGPGRSESRARSAGSRSSADVSRGDDVERMVAEVERELGPIDLLVTNAGIARLGGRAWEQDAADWWRVFEVNVLGAVPLLPRRAARDDRARPRPHREHGSGAALPPGRRRARRVRRREGGARAASASCSQRQLGAARRSRVFTISPGLVRTAMTERRVPRRRARGRRPSSRRDWSACSRRAALDALSGRYIHAEHDDVEDLTGAPTRSSTKDLNAIRLRRYWPTGMPVTCYRLPWRHGVVATIGRVPVFICPNCKQRSIDTDGYEGFSQRGRPVPQLRVRLPVRAARGLLSRRPRPGSSSATRTRACSPSGRGVFELTGFARAGPDGP